MKENKIVIISPVRDEEDFIDCTINSVLNQSMAMRNGAKKKNQMKKSIKFHKNMIG